MENTRRGDYKELIKNIVIFGLGLVGSKFVQFLLLPYFTNVLSTAEYGTIDLVITFVGLMVPIMTLELSDSVLRFGLSDDINKTCLLKNMFIVLLVGALVDIILSPFLFLYNTIWPYRIYVVSLIILQSIRTNFALFVKADNRLIAYSIDSIFTATVVAGCDIYFISFCKKGIAGYFQAEIIGNFVSIIFLFIIGKMYKYFRLHGKFDKELLFNMLKYSIPLMFNAISWWITSFSDRAILNIFFSESEVGIYSVAAKVPAIITTLLSVFTQAWVVSAVRKYERDSEPRFFENVYKIYTTLLFVSVALVILIVKQIMKIYVGRDFFEAWYYVPILLIGSVFLGISNYYGAIYAAAKANLLEIKSTIICAISNIVLNFVLIPSMGVLGAVIATALSYIIVVVVRIIDSRKIILIKINILELIISSLIILALTYFSMQEKPVAMLLTFIFLVAWKGIGLKYEHFNL